jgi:hypothetical protein
MITITLYDDKGDEILETDDPKEAADNADPKGSMDYEVINEEGKVISAGTDIRADDFAQIGKMLAAAKKA